MRKIANERHAAIENLASDLDILGELDKRGALDEELKKELEFLKRKDKGLQIVLELLEKYAKEHWMYIIDLSLDYHNILNCDLLLLTSTDVHTFEINHYEGLYEYKNRNDYLNGKKLERHPITMAQKVRSQIKSTSMMESIHLNVKGAAIFTGSDNKLEIHDEVKDVKVVTHEQLEDFIKRIAQEEKKQASTVEMKHLRWLAKIDRYHPIWPAPISNEIRENIRLGIACSYCEGFDVEIGEVFIACPCGGWESLEEATVRTICDYGVLNNGKDLSPLELHHFFNEQVSIEHIEKYLKKHFEPVMQW